MSESLNSTNNSTSTEALEEIADLTLNHDEVLDLELALGALGGLRHSAACDAAERSTRRFDERNHRLHEARMKAMGMDGEKKELEADDMSQQVLIRSPIIHNHYSERPSANQPAAPATASQPAASTVTPPATPAPAENGKKLSPLAKAAIVAALIGSPLAGGLAAWYFRGGDETTIVQPVQPGDSVGIENVPAGPPNPDRAKIKKAGTP